MSTTSWIDSYSLANDPNAFGIETPLAPARPNTFPNGLPTTTAQPETNWFNDQNPLSQSLQNLFGNSAHPSGAVGDAVGKALTLGGVSFSVVDIVAVVAGLLLIGGAIFGLDSVRETTINVARRGAEVASA